MSTPDPRIETIFHAALTGAPAERGAFVTKACAGDESLQKEVQRLLAAHEDAGTYFEPPNSPEIEAELARLKPEEEGERIGHYKLLQEIGQGGFGTVWMAEQLEPVSRRVALKIIKMGMDTREVIGRFEQERQALAMMDHPNIAKVFDAGATPFGRPYFVMELVKGVPITEFCDEHQLDTRQRLELFADVCSAINHAHQKGIIHRDIKPSNVMITLHGDKPVVKVIDFGIAKATQGKLTDKTVFTRFEQFIGTPAYMSPEQTALSGLDIDTRSDIYALGILLYELLTGAPPFDTKSLASAGYEEMLRIIREVEPPRPSLRLSTTAGEERTKLARARQIAPEKLNRTVEADLDWIVMKAIEKDRTRRYETANGLALDIQRFLANEPVSATPPSASYRFRKFARRNRTSLGVVTVIAAVLVAATTVSVWQAKLATKAKEQATEEAAKATASEKLASERLVDSEKARQEAEAISKFITEIFQSAEPARDGRTITVAEKLSQAAKKLESDLVDQPARRAHLQATLGNTFWAMGLPREAIPLGVKVMNYYLVTFGAEHPKTIEAMNRLANSYSDVGRRDEALKLREEVLALRRKVLGPEHPDVLEAMNQLANSYSDVGRRDEALKLREEVLALRRKVSGPEHPHTLGAITNLANSYGNVGRQDEALKLREEVLALHRKVSGPEHPETHGAMSNLAVSYRDAGRQEEALKLWEEALALSRKVSGPEHPETFMKMGNLAVSYRDAGRQQEALKLCEEALALYRKVSGLEHPETLVVMSNLAICYAMAGRQDEAVKLCEEALALHRKASGPEHPGTLVVMRNLAICYEKTGRMDEALKLCEEMLALHRKVSGPEHPETLGTMTNLAISYKDAGRKGEALKLGEEALPLFRKVLGPEHFETLGAMTNLAIFYRDAGHLPEAVSLQEESLAIKRRVLSPNHPFFAVALGHMATLYAKTGRKDEALKLREELLTLRRKALGPEHPDTLKAMHSLSFSYHDGNRRKEALKLREDLVVLSRKVHGPEHPETLNFIDDLSDSLMAAGRTDDALALLTEHALRTPDASFLAQKATVLQVWLGKDVDFETTIRRVFELAAESNDPSVADRAAKSYCLRPSTDPNLMDAALALARRAVDLGKNRESLPLYQMALGMAEYRRGDLIAAEAMFQKAAQAAAHNSDVTATAAYYRAMILFQRGHETEARQLFIATAAEMRPLPADENNPMADADSNALIIWLTHKEAKALIQPRK